MHRKGWRKKGGPCCRATATRKTTPSRARARPSRLGIWPHFVHTHKQARAPAAAAAAGCAERAGPTASGGGAGSAHRLFPLPRSDHMTWTTRAGALLATRSFICAARPLLIIVLQLGIVPLAPGSLPSWGTKNKYKKRSSLLSRS